MLLSYSMKHIFHYNPVQWRPFRISILLAILFAFLTVRDSGQPFTLYYLLPSFIKFLVFFIIILYIATAILSWVFPARKGFDDYWKDWWKP